MTTFADLGVDQDIVDALAEKGIVDAFPIQEQTIPLGLPGQDIIGQAKTGTGKTLGFGVPIAFQLRFDIYSTVMLSLGLVGSAYIAETIRARWPRASQSSPSRNAM